MRENTSMTPMIDIVFLLLIFFVCASVGQIKESLLPTELSAGSVESPDVSVENQPLVGELWLHLRRTERNRTVVEFDNPEFGRRFEDFNRLKTQLLKLANAAAEMPVILDIEATVPVGDVIRIYDTCRAANFESIHFATEPESG